MAGQSLPSLTNGHKLKLNFSLYLRCAQIFADEIGPWLLHKGNNPNRQKCYLLHSRKTINFWQPQFFSFLPSCLMHISVNTRKIDSNTYTNPEVKGNFYSTEFDKEEHVPGVKT